MREEQLFDVTLAGCGFHEIQKMRAREESLRAKSFAHLCLLIVRAHQIPFGMRLSDNIINMLKHAPLAHATCAEMFFV